MPEGYGQRRTTLIVGDWGHVGPGCCPLSDQNDFAAHFNNRAGAAGSVNFPQACMLIEPLMEQTGDTNPTVRDISLPGTIGAN
jgi:hypothetical protein